MISEFPTIYIDGDNWINSKDAHTVAYMRVNRETEVFYVMDKNNPLLHVVFVREKAKMPDVYLIQDNLYFYKVFNDAMRKFKSLVEAYSIEN